MAELTELEKIDMIKLVNDFELYMQRFIIKINSIGIKLDSNIYLLNKRFKNQLDIPMEIFQINDNLNDMYVIFDNLRALHVELSNVVVSMEEGIDNG